MVKDFNLPATSQSKTVRVLVSALTSLMSHRSVASPPNASQGSDDSLESFMADVQRKSVCVSPAAYTAALCYARLISVRGSYAVGAVDVAALSTMAAMMRRWCSDGGGDATDAAGDEGQAAAPTGKRKRGEQAALKPNKRSKRNDGDYEPIDDAAASSTHFAAGAAVSSVLAAILSSQDFSSFSPDASEQLVEVLAVSLACSSSLASLGSDGQDRDAAAKHSESIKQGLTQVLIDPTLTLRRRHETAVLVLRALFPLLSLTVETCNGGRGRLAAFHSAAGAVEDLIRSLAEFDFEANARRDDDAYNAQVR